MPRIKAHVRSNSTAVIICPSCNNIKTIAAETFRQRRHRLRLRCRCGKQFQMELDFRRHYRKQDNLTGYYAVTNGIGGGVIHIHNISRGGMGFTVSGIHAIHLGHLIELTFELNDKKRTRLKKNAIVRSVNANRIGCEFLDETPLEKALGFYLQT